MKNPYTVPKLKSYDDLSKTWYVWFRYEGKLIKKTGDINRVPSKKDRTLAGNALAKALLSELKSGWNPNGTTQKEQSLTLTQAIDFVFEKKSPNLAPKSASVYKTVSEAVKKALIKTRLDHLYANEIERSHIRMLLENISNSRDLSNKGHNKYLSILQIFLNEMCEWDILKYNPAKGMRTLRTEESEGNTPPTDNEWKAIKSFLTARDANFLNFCLMILYTGIRPVELTRIKIDMIDVNSQTITLPPSITKTKTKRIVPVSDHVWHIVERASSYPDNFYLFGSYRQEGKGNHGKFDDFITGPTPIKRDTATRRWNSLIKEQLGIDVNMYSLKHYGASVFLRSGIPIDAVRHLFGHSTVTMTERYVKDIKGIYRDQYMSKVPEI